MKKWGRLIPLLLCCLLYIALSGAARAETIPRFVVDGLKNSAFTDEHLESHDFSVIFGGGASVEPGMREWLTKKTYKVLALWKFKGMDVDAYGSGVAVVWGGKQYIVTAAHTIAFLKISTPLVYVMDYRGNIIPCTVLKIKKEGDVAVLVPNNGASFLPETCTTEISLSTTITDVVYSGGYYLNIPVIRGHVVEEDFGVTSTDYCGETRLTIKVKGQTVAGFSGGPVVNASQQLVGIMIAISKNKEDDFSFFSSSVNIVNLLRLLP